MDILGNRIRETIDNLSSLLKDERLTSVIYSTAEAIERAMRSGCKLMICGNGGSAADAQHMAGEFLCRFYKDRDPLPAIALSTDTSILTSVANDYSFNDVFLRQVKGLGNRGDVLLGISTSGSSANIYEAFKTARGMGITTILLTGSIERSIAGVSDIVVSTPSTDTPRIQEMHLVIEHFICEKVEENLHGGNPCGPH